MKIISFALFGTDEKYRIGFLHNVETATKHYPEWVLYVYCDKVNYDALKSVPLNNTELILAKEASVGVEGMSWRLRAAAVSGADAVIFRDADSHFTARERRAVDEWLASKYDVHLIRDHPYHVSLVMGGMFGVRGQAKILLSNLVDAHLSQCRTTEYGDDQEFLSKYFYPKIKHRALVHTDSIKYLFEYTLPLGKESPDEQFIGAYAYVSDVDRKKYADIKNNTKPKTFAPPHWAQKCILKKIHKKFPVERITHKCKWKA